MSKGRIMRNTAAVIVTTIAALMTVTANADLIGHFRVSGTMPDGSHYSGVVAVHLDSNIFHVVREINGKRETGTGIGYKNVLAVTYNSSGATILALYTQDDAGQWTGTWTRADSNQIGSERWQPYAPHQQE